MKVRMRTIAAGPTLVASPGQVVDVSDEQGGQLVAGGFAERIGDAETAAADPRAARTSETASLPAKGAKGSKGSKKAAAA